MMKKSIRIICVVIALVLVLIFIAGLLVGCSAPKAESSSMDMANYNSRAEAPQAAAPMEPAAPAAPAPMPASPSATHAPSMDEAAYGDKDIVAEEQGLGGDTGGIGVPDANSKVIRNGYLEFMSKNFDADVTSLKNAAIARGGFIESSNISGRPPVSWNDSGRQCSIVFRIPSKELDAFWGTAVTVGTLLSQQISSQDVTSQYFDTESRVNTLRIQLERLENIMTKSEKLSDIIALEQEIARVRYEIESLTTDLKRWDRLVSYSTVNVMITEETTVTRPPEESPVLGERIAVAMRSSFNRMSDFLKDLLVFVVRLIPTLILLAIIAVITLLIVRRSMKKASARRASSRERFENTKKTENINENASEGSKEETKNE